MRLSPFLLVSGVCALALIAAPSHAQDTDSPCPNLPPHISVAGGYAALACDLSQRSSTLAQQLRVLTESTGVYVAIRQPMGVLYGCRARARISRSDFGVHALIEIPFTADFAELLSHELEHVIEQLEGIDLVRMASDARMRVYRTASGAFETERARQKGRAVRREVLDH